LFFFSAGVGRAGTFCVIYSAIRELNGTGNIGKDRAMLSNSFLLSVATVQTIGNFIRGIVVLPALVTHSSYVVTLFFTFYFSGRS